MLGEGKDLEENGSIHEQKISWLLREISQVSPSIGTQQIVAQNQVKNDIHTDELKRLLDFKSGSIFDVDVYDQLISQVREQFANRYATIIPLKGFCEVYIAAESILQQKIEENQIRLEEFDRIHASQVNTLAQTNEVLNSYGIAEGSKLIVSVKTLNLNIPSSSTQQTSIEFIVPNNPPKSTQTVKGSLITFNTTLELQYLFNLGGSNIFTGQEQLDVIVRNIDGIDIGRVTIPLTNLIGQHPIEEIYTMFNASKSQIGTLQLELQWTHSQVLLLKNEIAEWEQTAAVWNEELDEFRQDLAALYTPFPQYAQFFKFAIESNPQIGNNNRQQQANADVFEQEKEYEAIDLTGTVYNQTIQVKRGQFKLLLVVFAISLLVTLSLHLYRAQFLDVMIYISSILLYETKRLDHKACMYLFASLFVSCVFDYFWLDYMSDQWWSDYESRYSHYQIPIPDSGIRQFSVILSFVSLITKLILEVVLVIFSQEIKGILTRNTELTPESPSHKVQPLPIKAPLKPLNFTQNFNRTSAAIPPIQIQPVYQGQALPPQTSSVTSGQRPQYMFGNIQESIIKNVGS